MTEYNKYSFVNYCVIRGFIQRAHGASAQASPNFEGEPSLGNKVAHDASAQASPNLEGEPSLGNKSGFTIPEVLISLTILTMVIFTVTSLVVSIIRTNKENIDTLIAYGLAQEGIEAIRNIRDSDWLLGAGFDGDLGGGNLIWGSLLKNDGGVLYLTVEPNKLFVGEQEDVSSRRDVMKVTPWVLKDVREDVISKFDVLPGQGDEVDRNAVKELQLNKYSNEKTGKFYYAHNRLQSGLNDLNMEESETIYYRYLEIREVGSVRGDVQSTQDNQTMYKRTDSSGEANPDKMQVSAVVTWPERDRWREVRLETVLTDWNTR